MWFSRIGLAEYLQCSPSTIEKLKGRELIEGVHYFKAGGLVRYKQSAIDQWLESGSRPSSDSECMAQNIISNIVNSIHGGI